MHAKFVSYFDESMGCMTRLVIVIVIVIVIDDTIADYDYEYDYIDTRINNDKRCLF